jgi:hypothetical protein
MSARKRSHARRRASQKQTRASSAAFARFPKVLAALAAERPLTASVVEAGCATLLIEGRQLTSAYDRQAEAELQASRIDAESREATVYGVALGDLPRVLLARPRLERLRVVMLDVAVVATTLAHEVDHDWALDPRVEVVLGVDETAVRTPYAVAPVSLALADLGAARIRDAIWLSLVAPFQALKYGEREAASEAAIAANGEIFRTDPDVRLTFATHKDGRALIAAAGPTLSENLSFVREQREGAVLIAVTTALRPLFHAGLRPDFTVVIDPHPDIAAHFVGLAPEWMAAVPLVYVPCVHPDVLKAWQGPRYGAYLQQPRYQALARVNPRGTLYCSGTVAHTAVDLAVRMGCAEVVLLGTDFAYVNGRSHATGAAHERNAPSTAESWVVSGDGQRVASNLAFVGFLRDLEGYIAAHPSVRFRSRSRRGARIAGTTWI